MTTRILKRWVATSLLLVGLGACNTYAQFQEADTLPKGTFRGGFGASASAVGSGDSDFGLWGAALHGFGRYGVTDRFELHGGIVGPFMGGSLGAKLQLVGGPTQTGFALSLGTDLGYFSDLPYAAVDATNRPEGFQLTVPVFLGWRLADWAQVQLTPNYSLNATGRSSDFESGVGGTDHHLGGYVGVTLGRSVRFHGGLSCMYSIGLDAVIVTPSLGISFGP